MTNKIKLMPSGVVFECGSEKTILDAAIDQGIVLEHSCKNGSCNACEAHILSPQGEILTTILTCQVKPDCDMTLEAEYYPELANIKSKTAPCKVDSIEYPHEDIVIITLRLPPTANLIFLPGQYLDLKYQGITRSYSIASIPKNNSKIELHLKRVENGAMSSKVFSNLSANQLMQLEGPKGTFFYRNNESSGPIIFLATGTGFAPIKSIVTDLLNNGVQRDIYIYWGNRKSSLFYDPSVELWESQHANVKCNLVLSQPEEGWNGRYGYVQEFVIADIGDLNTASVYACGSQSMIESAKALLIEKGLPTANFYSDAFVVSG
ncbi:CDP-6-deoxy-delta-3,4-glucoseen reductase [Pectobacterium zantedeschiae]|uniref:CDP-6-deoxy-delta-3,4-glucoseen reductase n=1 Tax=Pectobacterium zantedeschiae TaxID=2034769 RepID=UPI00101C23EB|nr:CDP-6-deoxy-delta-3,4-glucoseen reductase [Pectobacterium zantedeschiae]RYC47822.1 CDP-6-deoxy-delta-3,4-glucoseen reductase [Pectobacterium zantedeschiae]